MFPYLLIINLYIIMFHVCLVPLTHFSHKVLTSCITVIPFRGLFKNIAPKKGEDLLYSVCMIYIFVSLNIKNILLLFRSL